MATIHIPKDEYTIPVYNLTNAILTISVPYGGHVFRNFIIEKNKSTNVDRDLFLMGREIFQVLRKEGKIYYDDHVQVPCDEQELGCDGGTGGATGIQGSTGEQGSTGIAGGATGLQGVTGLSGPTGAYGGPQGDTGLQGVTGPLGGPIGATGLSGPQGDTGVGMQGVTGMSGSTGPLGGPIGATGLQGPQGDTGVGLQGVTGLLGPTGAYGGPQGDTGLQGVTGPLGGPMGVTGVQGPMGMTGVKGVTGIGLQGATGMFGPIGATGLQGSRGNTGIAGSQWYEGNSAPSGTANNGDLYLDLSTGNVYKYIGAVWAYQGNIKGPTGPQGNQGTTGVGGGGGGGGITTVFGVVNRYQADSQLNAEVWVTSTSVLYNNLAWSRSGTTLTVTNPSHGHSLGNAVILRNTNTDYIYAIITNVTTNTFDITVANTGPASGSAARYSLGFTYAHNIGGTGGNLFAPTGGEVQLISMRIRTGERAGTTYDVVVPASVTNGAGQNTSPADVNIPSFSVRADSDTLAAIAGTIAVNQLGLGYSTFTIGNLGAGTLSRFILLQF